MTKRSLSFILVLAMCLTAFAPMAMAEDAAAPVEREKIMYGTPTEFTDGETLTEAHTELSLTGYEDGHAIAMVTAEGNPNITTIIDLDDEKVLHKFEHTDFGGYAYRGDVAEDGRMYMGAGNDLLMYNPNTKEFKYLATPPMNISGLYHDVVIDETRNKIYTSEAPRGNINVTDMDTGSSSTLINMKSVEGRGNFSQIAEQGDYLYASPGYNKDRDATAYLWKIHKDTGDAVAINNPDDRVYTGFNYNRVVGDRYILTATSVDGVGQESWVYDIDTDTWTPFPENMEIKTSMISEAGPNGERIFVNLLNNNVCTVDGDLNFKEYNFQYGSHLRGTGPWVELKGHADMPGVNAVTAQYNGNIFAINLQTQKVKQIMCPIPGPGLPHRVSYLNPMDDMLYIGAFKGGFMSAVNTRTGEVSYLPADQPEGMIHDPNTGLFYHGDYSGAHIREVDSTKEMGRGLSGARGEYADYYFGTLGGKQDRPFDLEVVGRDLWITTLKSGSAPYGSGAVSVINLDTEEKTVMEGLQDMQSFVTVAGDPEGKYVYAGTTVSGGSSSPADKGEAMIFKFDAETKEVVLKKPLKIPTVSGKLAIVNLLHFGQDGTLYGGTSGVICKIDPDTLEVTQYNIYDSTAIGKDAKDGSQYWHECDMYVDPQTGYLFNRDGMIFDPDTLEVVVESPGYGFFAGIDSKGNGWFVKGTRAYKCPIIRGDDKSYLLSGVTFFKTGEDVMYRNGDPKDFVTYEDNGRVMVPLRNAATSMGGIVEWDAKTNVATLTNAAGNTITLNTGNNVVNFDGEGKKFGVYMKVENGVTYIPMQTLCDFLNVELVEARGINFIASVGSNYKPSQELLDYIESEVYSK
ncbi:MAG: stalk domain-containing protein [Clostridia bacterium]|nr:stalk domain-containing protein [Clostridia bacterium]